MKKKITSVLVTLLSCLIVAVPTLAINVFAESALPRLVDDAELLTNSEETSLLDRIDEVSKDYKCDIVIVTVDSLGDKTSTEYADDFFDYNGYGFGDTYDGILLLVSMEERDWAISTTGYGIEVFTDAGLDYIEDEFIPYLSKGEYAKSFNCFVDCCEKFLIQAENGNPYDIDNMPIKLLELKYIPIAIIIGFIIATIVVSVMKSSLTSVRNQKAAANYMRNGSMKITNQRDSFLYKNVSKIKRDTSSSSSGGHRGGSSTHRSSSGKSHGGSHGKF